jgi:hypothetical protein
VFALDHARAGLSHTLLEQPPPLHRHQWIDLGNGQREILLAGVAMVAAGAFVDVEEASGVRIDDLDRVVGVIQERAEPERGLALLVRAAFARLIPRFVARPVARGFAGLIAALGRIGGFGRHIFPLARGAAPRKSV